MRSFSRIVLIVFLSFLVSQPLLAVQNDDYSQWDVLINRQHNWPKWKLPTFFISSDLKEELHYPYWFQGLWSVESVDLDSQKQTSIKHLAHFKMDDSQNVVPDRFFNANSIAQQVFGKKFLEVKHFSKAPSLQLISFNDGSYLETRVVGRKQANYNTGIYIYDELVLEIFYHSGLNRINKVETIGKFMPCDKSIKDFYETNKDDICAEQFQARYNLSNNKVSSYPDSFHHYSLRLTPLSENDRINTSQDHLSK